jgi:hypothetical protein
MAEKPGYWDVHRCAWVDAVPDDMGLGSPEPVTAESVSSTAGGTVPEQRPDMDAPLVAGTPD